MITTVTGKNQITMPAELAKQLRIKPGTRLRWQVDEHGVITLHVLASRSELARRVAGMGRDWVNPDQSVVAELVNERRMNDR